MFYFMIIFNGQRYDIQLEYSERMTQQFMNPTPFAKVTVFRYYEPILYFEFEHQKSSSLRGFDIDEIKALVEKKLKKGGLDE